MAWEKKVWVDNQTPLCAENMNHLEDGIDSKVDKSTSKKVLYGTNDEGTAQVVLPYSLSPGESNIAQFDTGGHLYTKLPSIGDHCANKEYVDSCVQNMPTDINVDKDHKLILEHNGAEISGQKKQVLIPPFIYQDVDGTFGSDETFRFKQGIYTGDIIDWATFIGRNKIQFHYQGAEFNLNMDNTGPITISGNTYNLDGGIDYDYTIKLPYKKSGTVALLNDITSALENNLPFGTNTDIDNMF